MTHYFICPACFWRTKLEWRFHQHVHTDRQLANASLWFRARVAATMAYDRLMSVWRHA